jgi:hypothetical protein
MSTANQCATVAQIDLDNLEALARAATPGPWRQCVGTGATEVRGEPAGGQSSPRVSRILRSDPNAEENAAFIEAANPAAVLALIEQDRAKDVEIADLGAQLARQRQGDVAELDWLKYDAAIDALEIHGIRYATALFTEFASSLPEGQALKFVGRENGVVCLERISSPTLGSAPQALRGVRWDLFPGYLIDHHEGDTITEEGLQFAAAGMLKDEQYIAALATQPQQAAERAGVPDGYISGDAAAALRKGRDVSVAVSKSVLHPVLIVPIYFAAPIAAEKCPCCPIEVRDLHAVAHNLIVRSPGLADGDLKRAVEKMQPLMGAHFANRAHSHPEPAAPTQAAQDSAPSPDGKEAS